MVGALLDASKVVSLWINADEQTGHELSSSGERNTSLLQDKQCPLLTGIGLRNTAKNQVAQQRRYVG